MLRHIIVTLMAIPAFAPMLSDLLVDVVAEFRTGVVKGVCDGVENEGDASSMDAATSDEAACDLITMLGRSEVGRTAILV